MRPIERIDNFLEKVNWSKLQEKWEIPVLEIDTELIRKAWKSNPDQRIGQLLINLGLIDDSIERWSTEDSTVLIDQGVAPEDCLYWTSIYDKDGNPLEEPATRLISTLSEKHIEQILRFMQEHKGKISFQQTLAFGNMLRKYKELPELQIAA